MIDTSELDGLFFGLVVVGVIFIFAVIFLAYAVHLSGAVGRYLSEKVDGRAARYLVGTGVFAVCMAGPIVVVAAVANQFNQLLVVVGAGLIGAGLTGGVRNLADWFQEVLDETKDETALDEPVAEGGNHLRWPS